MGKVLAMMGFVKWCCGAVLCFGLAGCGTDTSSLGNVVVSGITGLVRSDQPAGPSLRDRLTPEALATIDGPILIIELPDRDAEAGAQILNTRGPYVLWSTQNAIHFTFRNGVLQSTRGISGDLMSANLDEVVPAIQGRRSEAIRIHRYLDGEDQIVARAFVCSYARQGGQRITTVTGTFRTTKVTETCTSTDRSIENHYWLDGRGTVRKSKQWVGPFVGFVLTERVND